MKTLRDIFLKKRPSKENPQSPKKLPSLETQFLGVMILVIVSGLFYQLSLGYFHQPLPAAKISPVKRQNLARAMESVERKRHQILTGQGK